VVAMVTRIVGEISFRANFLKALQKHPVEKANELLSCGTFY